MMNFDTLCPVGLISDSVRVAVSEDVSVRLHMRKAALEAELADIDLDYEDMSDSVRKPGKVRRDRKERARRHRKANIQNAMRDRYHGKRGKEWKYNPYADHETKVYLRGLVGEYGKRGKRLEKALLKDLRYESPVFEPVEPAEDDSWRYVNDVTLPYDGKQEASDYYDDMLWDDYDPWYESMPLSAEEAMEYIEYFTSMVKRACENGEDAEALREEWEPVIHPERY